MLFAFVSLLAACPSLGMRPEVGRVSAAARFAKLEDLGSKISSSKDGVVALKAAQGIVDDILSQTGNATEHMSSEDQALLTQVITLVEETIFGSLDDASAADAATLQAGVDAADLCNVGINQRQSADGDLGKLNAAVTGKQNELDALQGIVDEKTLENASAWTAFELHNQNMQAAPACPEFPARTKPALDVYFESSAYANWFGIHQDKYHEERAIWLAASDAVDQAIANYNIGLAVRDTQYCDYKSELELACAAFDLCFQTKSDLYTDETSPRVRTDMEARIEVYKSGQELVHQVKFLLGTVSTQEAPAPDTSRYELTFPPLPPKTTCDLTVLVSDAWTPVPEC